MESRLEHDVLERFDLLASACRAAPEGSSWRARRARVDRRREVFVDADASPREQLEALAVQASLLAAGSLEPGVVRRFTRRPALARRYLAIEGHRALAANQHLLPRRARSLIDGDVAARADSPAASMAAALSSETITDPPESFGAIRARHLLASDTVAMPRPPHVSTSAPAARPGAGRARRGRERRCRHRRDFFSSPVGGGGALGRLLQRMLRMVRSQGGGPPGVEHRRIGRAAEGEAAPWRVLDRNRGDPGGRRHRRPGDEIPRVGRSSTVLSPGLVHGARGRAAVGGRHAAPGVGRVRLASIARPSRHGPRLLPPTGSGRRHRYRCGGRGARRGDGRVGARRGGLHRQPSTPARSRRAAALDISGSVAEPGATARPCTSTSGRRPPHSRLLFTISAIAWRSTPFTRRGDPPCTWCR